LAAGADQLPEHDPRLRIPKFRAPHRLQREYRLTDQRCRVVYGLDPGRALVAGLWIAFMLVSVKLHRHRAGSHFSLSRLSGVEESVSMLLMAI